MTLPSTLGFIMAMLILAASPGPGVFATVASTLAAGPKKTLPLILGIILGDILYLLFAVFGMSIIARTMGEIFTIIKLLGGAYLIFLGIKIYRSKPEINALEKTQPVNPLKNFSRGLLITLSNPKVIIFYCGFLPAFVNLTTLNTKDIILIAALVAIILAAVLLSYSLAAGKTRQFFKGSNGIRNLNRTAGAVMGIAGVLLATRR